MAIKSVFRFANLTGLTSVTTAGTVAIDSGAVKFDPGTGTTQFQVNGLYMSTPVTLAHGDIIYAQLKLDAFVGSHDFIFAVCSSAINFSGKAGYRLRMEVPSVSSTLEGYDDNTGVIGTQFNVAADTYVDLKILVRNDGGNAGKLRLYYRTSTTPGALNPNSGAWTEFGTAGVVYTNGGSYHLAVNAKAVNVANSAYHMDDWYWTNDGSILPTVDAGTPQSIAYTATANLSGTVDDPGATLAWTKTAGPGSVFFSATNILNPTATFSAGGTYTLQLAATNGEGAGTDTVTITVTPPEVKDHSEFVSSGWTKVETSGTSTFAAAEVVITHTGATDFDTSGIYRPTGILFAADDVVKFTYKFSANTNGGLLGFATTDALDVNTNRYFEINYANGQGSVRFTEAGGATTGSTPFSATADTWYDVMFVTLANGKVSAYHKAAASSTWAFMGTTTATVAGNTRYFYVNTYQQNITWTIKSPYIVRTNLVPVASAGDDAAVLLADGVDLDGSATADSDSFPSALTYSWSEVSGPGDVTFDDDTLQSPHADFSEAGEYVLRVTVTDAALSDTDDVTITVTVPATGGTGTNTTQGKGVAQGWI